MDEIAVTLLGGGILVPLLQAAKGVLGIKGTSMLWLTAGASVVMAGGITAFTGRADFLEFLTNPELLLTGSGAVMTTATLLYGSIKERMRLGGEK